VVTENVQTPMGLAVDTAVLDKQTLVLKKRSLKQGPMSVDVAFEGGKATGTIALGGGEPKQLAVDLGGELFGDGAGAADVLAQLPLRADYATTFRTFDIQKQKPALKQLKVVGQEDVTVPAGTFKAWKAEITSAEGDPGQMTIWVAADARKTVKTTATLPQMGGAVFTMELK
jgi:hypothetical protein